MSSEEELNLSDVPSEKSVVSCQSVLQLNNAELREVLKRTQLKYQKLAHAYNSLQIEYNTLEATKSTGSKARKSLSGEDREVGHARARFVFAYELWVDCSILDNHERPLGVDPHNPDRYDTQSTQELAIIAEVYESLPSHLQEALADPRRRPSFISLFQTHAKTERATIVHTTRQIAGQLFKLDPEYFYSQSDRTAIPELKALLYNPSKPEEKYPPFPPMLFPLNDCNSTSPFMVKELARFLKSILFGLSTLGGDAAGRRALKSILWGITETTPGMIALAATVLTFVCGPDQTFSEKSKGQSCVDWGERFLLYKQAILKFPPQYYERLISWYNAQIFGTRKDKTATSESTSAKKPPPPRKRFGAVDDLIQRMESTDVTSPSSSTTVAPDRPSPTPSFHASALQPAAASELNLGDQVRGDPLSEEAPQVEAVARTNKKIRGGG
ncbi:hypothetical protein EDB86DRAFT_2839908 [Lactarius hatsudake]|nr:hypothetical protein EDB86DRAFT_2839908 [Lactarius hatsudake]